MIRTKKTFRLRHILFHLTHDKDIRLMMRLLNIKKFGGEIAFIFFQLECLKIVLSIKGDNALHQSIIAWNQHVNTYHIKTARIPFEEYTAQYRTCLLDERHQERLENVYAFFDSKKKLASKNPFLKKLERAIVLLGESPPESESEDPPAMLAWS